MRGHEVWEDYGPGDREIQLKGGDLRRHPSSMSSVFESKGNLGDSERKRHSPRGREVSD